MAAAFARSIGGGRVVVHSAGTAPGEHLNPAVVAAMRERGIDIAGERPQALNAAMALRADVVVTMGCGDTCPVYPSKRYVDWGLADPAGLAIEEVRSIRDDVERRVVALLGELSVGGGAGEPSDEDDGNDGADGPWAECRPR